ncbi:hypothetical protein [Thioalkalivibrio sp. ALgr3]|uniref:hypothetical protein n=1 Tax=Thioalkalivibrio sp. ALgr3 TaxID=1239292 RepID=UPI000367CE25|nr:hypothetical protein [Thioalkalivibrio sp. ALgr3]
MSESYRTNTADGLPFSVNMDSLAIDAEEWVKDEDSKTPEAKRQMHRNRAKAQARKNEQSHTSEELERIRADLKHHQEQRAEKEEHLNNASHQMARGEGSLEEVETLRDEIAHHDSVIDALERAAHVEQDKLAEEYSDKLERAQAKLREQIDQATDEVGNSLEKLEKDVKKLEASFDRVHDSFRALIPLTKSPRAGMLVSNKMKEVAQLVGERIGIEGGNGPRNRDQTFTRLSPKRGDFQNYAEIPEYLEDLPEPDAD